VMASLSIGFSVRRLMTCTGTSTYFAVVPSVHCLTPSSHRVLTSALMPSFSRISAAFNW
jgi:hypothetical protein